MDINFATLANACTSGQVRLKDGGSQRRGNVQVCVNDTWWEVCGQGNSRADTSLASVVCSELGYSSYGIRDNIEMVVILLLQVPRVLLVLGTYVSIITISISIGLSSSMYGAMGMNQAFLLVNMTQQEHVQVIMLLVLLALLVSTILKSVNDHDYHCLDTIITPVNCTDGSIRLYGGLNSMEGILHVCANKVWGTVCSHSWSVADNNVVCRQLGLLPHSEGLLK